MSNQTHRYAVDLWSVYRDTHKRLLRGMAIYALVVIGGLGSVAATTRALAAEPLAPIGPPSAEVVEALGLRPFYKQHLDAQGFAIIASEQVDKAALREAAYLVDRMLEGHDDVRRAMTANKVRLVVMSPKEFTTQIPEHSDLAPAKFWDKRARGSGATPSRPAVSCGEENLLGYDGDPYKTENILIHEFAHAIHEMGLRTTDPTFDPRLRAAYEAALGNGLWKGTYAATNPSEYWAEGVQSWFDCNRENDHQHNHVNTRDEIKAYDPPLAKLLAEMFGDKPWRYRRINDRPETERTHLAGFDPARAPRFEWPAELLEWNKQYAARQAADEKDLVELKFAKAEGGKIPPSKVSSRESSLLFVNRRNQAVKLYWIDPQGERKSYGLVPAGDRRRQHTFAGHTWLIVDPQEQPLGHFIADDEPGKAVVE